MSQRSTDDQIGLTAAGGLTTFVAMVGGAILAPGISAATRGITQQSNATWPTVVPPPEGVISAWQMGYLDDTSCARLLVANGVPTPGLNIDCGGVNVGDAWWKVIGVSHHRPSAGEILRAKARKLIPRQYNKLLDKRYKIDEEVFEATQYIYHDYPGVFETTVMLNRGMITPDEALAYVVRSGGYIDKSAEQLLELGKQIPGPSDLVRFGVRDAFNDNMANKLGLDLEYPESGEWPEWLAAQGLGTSTGRLGRTAGKEYDWAKLYWRSHWVLMSPGQAYEAFHRFRRNRLDLYRDDFPEIQPFELTDLNDLLKTNDYLPWQRDWLGAMSFANPRLVDLRKMWFTKTIDSNEFIEYMRDLGQTEVNAKRIVEAYKEDKDRYVYAHRTPKFDTFDTAYIHSLVEGFRVGSISSSELATYLLGILHDKNATDAYVLSEEIRKRNSIVKRYTDQVRKQYLTGEVLEGVALASLIDAGVDSVHARQLVSLWKTKFDLPTKAASISNIIQWYINGIIDSTNAEFRLLNLGVSPRDVQYHLLDMRKKKEAKDAKASGKKGGGGKKEQNYETPAKISEWFNAKYITKELAYNKLDALNVPADDWDRWLKIAVPIEEGSK